MPRRFAFVGLLLLSCMSKYKREEQEVGREVIRRIDAPTGVRLIRVTKDVTVHGACGATHKTEYSCELEVQPPGESPARLDVPCGARLEVSEDRFAVWDDERHGWRVHAGGYGGEIVTWYEQGFSTPAVGAGESAPDWKRAPSALDLSRKEAMDVIGRETTGYANEYRIPGLIANVVHLAGDRSHVEVAVLARSESTLKACPRTTSPWLTKVETTGSPAWRLLVAKELLAADTDAHAVIAGLRLVGGKDLLAHTGEPRAFLDAQPSRAADGALPGAVLDAWSLSERGAAADFACKMLGGELPGVLEDAAMLAIARAGLACPAVLTRTPRHCAVAQNMMLDAVAARARFDVEQTKDRDVLFCSPALATVYARVAASSSFDARALHAQCSVDSGAP